MAAKSSNYSIVVGVDFVQGEVQKKLDELEKKLKPITLKVDMPVSNSVTETVDEAERLKETGDDIGLSYQAANAILRKTVEIIQSMVDQTYELDTALTEFKKVSSFDGKELEDYKNQLADIGKTVARTGKPKCQARGVGMGNQH